jgi:four helix bundle protein
VRDFTQLKVWEKAHTFALHAYKVTAEFPPAETYGLTSQLRRSATSIPSNIAEGCGRNTRAEFVRFLHIAAGSASEAQYQLLLARDLGFLTQVAYDSLNAIVTEVKMMLASLISRAPDQ